jgi:hypothetical protein
MRRPTRQEDVRGAARQDEVIQRCRQRLKQYGAAVKAANKGRSGK